ncbi:MAG: hypothetical protein OXK80_03120 [Bdellovibrionales bacterium]|nr:hypothetical protein [Bdellovibrionales bacterium]
MKYLTTTAILLCINHFVYSQEISISQKETPLFLEDILPSSIAAFNSEQIGYLLEVSQYWKEEQVQAIPLEVISQIPDLLNTKALTLGEKEQSIIRCLTQEQIKAMTINQMKNNKIGITVFKPKQVSWMNLDQIKEAFHSPSFPPTYKIFSEYFEALSLEQMKAVATIGEREDQDFLSRIINNIENHKGVFKEIQNVPYRYLDNPASMQAIPFLEPPEFRYITSVEQMKHLLPDYFWMEILSPERTAQIPVYAKSLSNYSIHGLSPEHIQHIPLEQIPDLSLQVLSAMSYPQFSSFSLDQINSMSEEQLIYIAQVWTYSTLTIAERDKANQKWIDDFIQLAIKASDKEWVESQQWLDDNIKSNVQYFNEPRSESYIKETTYTLKVKTLKQCQTQSHLSSQGEYFFSTEGQLECAKDWAKVIYFID